MKYINQYEAVTPQPRIGDYVLCELDPIVNDQDKKLINFVENNIGVIIERKLTKSSFGEYNRKKFFYSIEYENMRAGRDYDSTYSMKDGTTNVILVFRTEIQYFSNNREDIEAILTAKKYNL